MSIRKKRREKIGLAGMRDIASGYVIKAKPGPDALAYFSTDSLDTLARKPMVANTANPAKMPVKQSHDTTMHICLEELIRLPIPIDNDEVT